MPEIDLTLLPDFFKVVSAMMVMQDGETHKSSRRICYHGFANAHIKRIEPLILQTINAQITKISGMESFDFMSEFANIIPMQTLADFFNIPEHDRLEFVEYAKTMTAFFGGGTTYNNDAAIKVNHAAKSLHLYFSDLYKQRKIKPADDFFSQLIANQSHFNLSSDQLISQAIMMWVAGMVTTSDQMANNFFSLVNDFPEIINDNISFADHSALINECNRLDPAVTFTFRIAKQDIKIDQQLIKQGQTIFISNHAVNRNSNIFIQPDRIELTRKQNNFSYGMGSHYCLGAKLSMLEMQNLFFNLFKAKPNLKITSSKRLHYSLSFSGFETIIVK